MKYAIKRGGDFVYDGVTVTVVSFSCGNEMREWVSKRPNSRTAISHKKYVTDESGKNVSVRAAAVTADQLGDSEDFSIGPSSVYFGPD